MERANVKIGQKVRVVATNLFYPSNLGKEGIVTETDEDRVYVDFEDGDDDYGYATDLELLSDPATSLAKEDITVKQAIANVEAALAVLKALVG